MLLQDFSVTDGGGALSSYERCKVRNASKFTSHQSWGEHNMLVRYISLCPA